MSEPKKSRGLRWAAIGGAIALMLSLLYFIAVLGDRPPRAETADQRAARCAIAPRGDRVVDGAHLAPLAEASALAEGGKLKPVFTNGSTVGLEIFQIRPESLYDWAGLCDGDVVTSVGGIRLDTPEATLDAYEQLRGQKVIAIELLRKGAPASYRVKIE